jgi:anthranilate phosphoribosyltransferase
MEQGVDVGQAVNQLINGQRLSQDQTKQVMTRILKNETSPMNQGAFLAAVSSQGLTPMEIAGAWQAIFDIDTRQVSPTVPGPLVDNCGTGMDGFKTFNISTAAAIVAAAGGVYLARHGARAITSRCGTVDLCEALGVDVEADAELVKASIESCGIGLFNGMSAAIHPQALFRILSQINFGSILNVSASLANPARPARGVRGVYAADMVRPVAETMRAIGYEKALVFHGTTGAATGGMDELSPVADSFMAELMEDGRILESVVCPHDFGIPANLDLNELAGGLDPEAEALRLIGLLAGKDKGALFEAVCLNTAPILYITEKAEDLGQGVALARRIIESGAALSKLHQWVVCQQRRPEGGQRVVTRLIQKL